MNEAAKGVLRDVQDIVLGYGQSDEFRYLFPLDCLRRRGLMREGSFVIHPKSNLYSRRSSKLVSTVVSTFTAYYVCLWPQFFPGVPLVTSRPPIDGEVDFAVEDAPRIAGPLPTFDGRVVVYPTLSNLRDYLSWRQVDCMIHSFPHFVFLS